MSTFYPIIHIFIHLNIGLLIKFMSSNTLHIYVVAQPTLWFASYLGTHT